MAMRDFQVFQISMLHRFEELDKKVDDGLIGLAHKVSTHLILVR